MNTSGEARRLLLIPVSAAAELPEDAMRRSLQQVGAAAIKQTAYVLPRSEQAQEDFEWLRAEIVAGGGDGRVGK